MPDNTPIIDDNNFRNFVPGQDLRGYDGMFQHPNLEKGFEDLGIPKIPEDQWDDILEQQERDQTTLRYFSEAMNLPHKDQKRTNYCWVFGPTHCLEIMRLKATGTVVSLSPASAGAPIKNFMNVGGWGDQALKRFISHGVNYSSDWPDTAIDRSYYTEENKQKALENRAIEHFNLRTWEEVGSAILAGIPLGVGYTWWYHLVCAVGLKKGNHDLLIRNSWQGWGDNGFGWLSGNRKYPDGTVAITAMQPA